MGSVWRENSLLAELLWGWEGVWEEMVVVYCIVLMLLVSLHLCLSLSACILSGCDMFELGPITEAQTEGMTTLLLCYHTVFCFF